MEIFVAGVRKIRLLKITRLSKPEKVLPKKSVTLYKKNLIYIYNKLVVKKRIFYLLIYFLNAIASAYSEGQINDQLLFRVHSNKAHFL
jgi:hypothetical protein